MNAPPAPAAPNFYLLDEPTNHLDIEGQEDLETQLEEAKVACLFVSKPRERFVNPESR